MRNAINLIEWSDALVASVLIMHFVTIFSM